MGKGLICGPTLPPIKLSHLVPNFVSVIKGAWMSESTTEGRTLVIGSLILVMVPPLALVFSDQV